MSTSRKAVILLSEDSDRRIRNFLTQMRPFWPGAETSGPTPLVKTSDFDQHWKVIPDPTGSYADEFGHRVAVRKHADNEKDANDVHWAAHNAAKFWALTSPIALLEANICGRNDPNHPLPMMARPLVAKIRGSCSKEVAELALQELTQTSVQEDTRTNIITPPNPYPYPGLLSDASAIRLVVLLPANEAHDRIVCKLCNSTLSRSEFDQYEALSYVWGDPSERRSITVNDRQFQASRNLESALRNLRYRDKCRVLWIDSMCINQNNVAERNKQVQQMDRIYKNAQSVVVWLGPESDTSSNAFNLSQRASDAVHNGDQYKGVYRDRFRVYAEALHHLSKRTWFTRIWCVQEFILGQRVVLQCGKRSTPWENLAAAVGFIAVSGIATNRVGGTLGNQVVDTLPNIGKLFKRRTEAFKDFESVLSLLSEFREWASSDPRDRIFAFYGLIPMNDPGRDALRPDYSLNTPQVYVKFAVKYLQAHRELDILSVATHPVTGFIDISVIHFLPSWVPDWRDIERFGAELEYRPLAFNGLGTHIGSIDKIYDAALGLKSTSLDFQEDFQVLVLDGVEVDTIEGIGELYMGGNRSPIHICVVVSTWTDIAGLSDEGCYRYSGQPKREAFWRTLLADDRNPSAENAHRIKDATPSRGSQIPLTDANLDWLHDTDLPHRSRIPLTNAKLDWFPNFPPSAQDDLKSFLMVTGSCAPIVGRRFFRTSKGLMGLAPASARKGDSVVVLSGGKVPFVLRRFDKRHYLVGESYVHGIMDGEAVCQPRIEEFQDLKVEKFLLA